MVSLDVVKDKLNLDDAEVSKIQKCAESYTRSSLIHHLAHLIFETFLSLFGYSHWQISKRILENKSIPILQNKFRDEANRAAKIFSEFLLRYLVTLNGEVNKWTWTEYIRPTSWGPIKNFDWEYILEHAPKGDGTTIPGIYGVA